ncbi:MAG: Urea channel UreI, partial [uncultured Rubrobacteraceae bacterium]
VSWSRLALRRSGSCPERDLAPGLYTRQGDLGDKPLQWRTGAGDSLLFSLWAGCEPALCVCGGAILVVRVYLLMGRHQPVLRRGQPRSGLVLPLRRLNGHPDSFRDPDGRGAAMVGFELVDLGSPMVRLLAAPRSGNDTAYTVQRCAYDPSRYRYGVDTRLPAPYRRFDVV